MMNPSRCAWARARAFRYLDGVLSVEDEAALRAHLTVCAGCRAQLASCRRAERALATSRDAIPECGDLRAAFYSRVTTEPSTSSVRARRAGAYPVLAFAAIAIVCAIVVETSGPGRVRVAPTLANAPDMPARVSSAPGRGGDRETAVAAGRAPLGNPSMLQPHNGLRRYGRRRTLRIASSRRSRTAGGRPVRIALAPEWGHGRPVHQAATVSHDTHDRRPVRIAMSVPASESAAGADTVDFRITDDVRGFTAALRVSTDNSTATPIIAARDDDAP